MKSQESPRLWFVSELFYPETASTGYVFSELAFHMAARGFRVSALCGWPYYTPLEKKSPAYEIHEGVEIFRYRAARGNKDVLWKRVINLVTITIVLFFATLRKVRRGDCVFIVTQPPVLPIVILAACRLKGAKSVFVCHDLYPEFVGVAGVLKRSSLIYRAWNAMTCWLCRKVDRISVLGRDMQKLLQDKRGHSPEDVILIPNWGHVDTITPTPRESNPLLQELKLVDKFVVQYAGNLGPAHDGDLFIRAARQLSSLPNLHFLVVGSGKNMGRLKSTVEELGLNNVTVLPPRPRSEAAMFLNACDVSLSLFVPGMYGVSVPSRNYHVLAAGKPIVAVTDPESELGLLLAEEEVGWQSPTRDLDGFVANLMDAYNHPEKVREYGRRARETAVERHQAKHSIDKMVELVATLWPPENMPDASAASSSTAC